MVDLAFVYVAKGLEVSFKVLNEVPADATIGWDFGVDNGFSNELNPTFTYESPGYYEATLTITEVIDGENIQTTSSQQILVTEAKTQLSDSIYNLIDLYMPANFIEDGGTMPDNQKRAFIQKWQFYIGPLVNHFIPIEGYTNEYYYEALENQLVVELVIWDYLSIKIMSLLTTTGQYIDSITSKEINKGQSSEDEEAGDEQGGTTGRIKRIQTGPTEVEYFEDISESLSTLYKSYSEALKPGGVIDILRQNICNMASRLQIFLPMCNNPYNIVKVPRVVNRRHPKGIDGPNPPTLLRRK